MYDHIKDSGATERAPARSGGRAPAEQAVARALAIAAADKDDHVRSANVAAVAKEQTVDPLV